MYFRKDLNGSYQAALSKRYEVVIVKRERSSKTETMKLFSCQAASWHLSTASQTQSATRTRSWICYNRTLKRLLLWLCYSQACSGGYFELQNARAGKAAFFLQLLGITMELLLQLKKQWLHRKGFGDLIETASISWNPKAEWLRVTKLDWERLCQEHLFLFLFSLFYPRVG